MIGDLAERIVWEWLKASTPPPDRDKIVWVADLGETPGYDIEDRRVTDACIGYEVKATLGSRFLDVEFTANELHAAKRMRDRYVLVLVADTESLSPRLQFIRNPGKLLDEGLLWIEPTAYRLGYKA
jgi:hypothetical protein